MGKLRPESDNRSGSISALIDDGSDNDPTEDQYNIDPGEEEFKPIRRELQARVSGADDDFVDVHLSTSSSYVGYDVRRASFDGLSAHSKGVVDYSLGSGQRGGGWLADHVAMGFCVEEACKLHIKAKVETDFPGPYLSLKGPGIDLPVLEHGSIDQTVEAAKGEYELRLTYAIQIALPNANAEPGTTVEMSATVDVV